MALTAAQIETELDNLETEEQALRSAFDFDLSTGAGGGKISVRGMSDKLAYIGKRRRYLLRRLHMLRGNRGFDQQRAGIDSDKTSENDDI